MAVSTRLRGNSGLFFSMKKGAASAVVYDDIKEWEITFEDKDESDLTFLEASTAGIGQNATFTATAIESFDVGSLWRNLWDNPQQSFTVVVGPKGNSTGTAGSPIFTFTATNPAK